LGQRDSISIKKKVENGGIQESSITPGEELDSVGSNLLEDVSENLFPDGPENTESVESSDFDETDQSSTREIIKRGIERREKRFTRTSISTLQKAVAPKSSAEGEFNLNTAKSSFQKLV